MEDRWVERLVDANEPLGTCFLREYARAMRLISGLCRRGFLRCLAQARHTRVDSETRSSLMAHPAIQEFTRFLREFPPDQVPMVWEVLTGSLYPNHEGGSLFRAGAIDPLRSPFQALEAAARDLRNAEAVLPALAPRCPDTPDEWEDGQWDPTAYTEVTTGIGQEAVAEDQNSYPDEFFLPSTIAGFGGPGASSMLFPHEPFVQVLHPFLPSARTRERKRRRRDHADQPAAVMEGSTVSVTTPAVARDPNEKPLGSSMVETLASQPAAMLSPTDSAKAVPDHVPEFEEIAVEAEPTSPRDKVPEPKVPPRPKVPVPEPEFPPGYKRQHPSNSQAPQTRPVDSQSKRVRKSRWDPEERTVTVATGSMFQLGFIPPAGLPVSVVPTVTKMVAAIQVILRTSPRASVDVVITKDDLDPMLQSKISDFGQVLRQYSLHSRLSLLSYGRAWKLKLIDHEVSDDVVTLFLHVEMMSQAPSFHGEPQSKKSGRPPRSRSPHKKPGSGSKPSGSGPSGTKDVGTRSARPVFESTSHGSKRCAFEKSSVSSSASAPMASALTVDTTQKDSEDEISVPPALVSGAALEPHNLVTNQDGTMLAEGEVEAAAAVIDTTDANLELPIAPAINEVSPTIPFSIRGEARDDEAGAVTSQERPMENETIARPSNWFLFPSDGRRYCSNDWIQVQSTAVQAVLRGGEVREILGTIRDLPFHPLGGFHGCTLAGPNCRVQVGTHAIAPEARSARAYKVSPVCLYCQEPTPIGFPIFECPHCHGDLGSFRLPNAHFSQLRGTQEIVDQIRPHHAELGSRSGLFNLSFRIKQIFEGFWLVQGPDNVDFWVLLPWDVHSLVVPAIDQPYYLYQAPCVGTIEGKFIMRAPSPRESGAMIRQHTSQDGPRTLELFSGIGGWHQALKAVQLQDVPITSVEINPIPARALAKSTGRPCVTAAEWLTTPLLQDFILNADIKDPTWWATTLVQPFSQVCFSAPCVPWSTAGCRRGLHDDDGLLLIHVAVLLVLFQVDFAVGENVPGLVNHPHWNQVKQVFESTGLNLDVRLHDLGAFGLMHRNRGFMSLTKSPVLWPDFQPQQGHDFNEVLLECWDRSRTQVPLAALPLLSARKLLPSNLIQKAYEQGLEDGQAILNLRVHRTGPLPTLVASYRNQTQLARKHLEDRGLYTWLIDSDRPRFLDPFEGARALGFSPNLFLPQDLDQAMKCVGNSLSPIQALFALFAVLPDDQKVSSDAFEHVLRTWLHGLRQMTDFRVLSYGDYSRLVLRAFVRPSVIDRFQD